jgi:hypothetical protein
MNCIEPVPVQPSTSPANGPLMARDNGRVQPSARPQMASLGNGRMTSFDLADWVRQSRASQGLPAKVADPAVIARLVALLRHASRSQPSSSRTAIVSILSRPDAASPGRDLPRAG